MIREIEFRGKNIESGEWLYGSHFTDSGEDYIIPQDILGIKDYEEYQVDQNTIGQFTGLRDKQGIKIYDGDILFVEFDDKSGGYNLVGWNKRTASWGVMNRDDYQSIKKDGYCFAEFKNYVLLAFLREAIICKVVGNIHDNADLLSCK